MDWGQSRCFGSTRRVGRRARRLVDQEKMIDKNYSPRSIFPPQAVAHNVNELKRDLLTLLRLQLELLAADTSECGRRLRIPVLWLAVAAAVGLGAVPVALLAGAAGLAAAGLHAAIAQAIAALVGLAAAAGMGLYAWHKFRSAVAVLQRSRDELQRNIESLKELFMQDWTGSTVADGAPGYPR